MSLLTELNKLNTVVESETIPESEHKYKWATVLKAFKQEIFRISKTKYVEDYKILLFGTDEFHPWENQGALEKALDSGDFEKIAEAMHDAFDESVQEIKHYFGHDKENVPLITVDYDPYSDEHVLNVLRDGAPEIYDALELNESKRAFARTRGNKIVRKIRCTAGKRRGRIVSKSADCFKRKNIKLARKARLNSKRTRAIRIRKTRLTLRRAVSKTVRRLNSRI